MIKATPRMLKTRQWYTHTSFKKQLDTTKDTPYYMVEEYNCKKFRIVSFESKNTFISQLVKAEQSNYVQHYYNIFYRKQRYLYLDIDMYLEKQMNKKTIYLISIEIIRILTNFYNKNTQNKSSKIKDVSKNDFYIFSSSRKMERDQKHYSFKLSLHVYCPKIVFDTTLIMQQHLKILQKYVGYYNELFDFPQPWKLAAQSFDSIDPTVYKAIQYFRCVKCCKYAEGNVSKKHMVYPKKPMSYIKAINLMQVDECNLKDVAIHYKTNHYLSNIVQMVNKTSHRFYNVQHDTINSIRSDFIIQYEFTAINNDLRWKERRIFRNGELLRTEYETMNANVEHPRVFAKIKGLTLKQIEQLNLKLNKQNIRYKDTYKASYWTAMNKKTSIVEYEIHFEIDNIDYPFPHKPKCIKKYTNEGVRRYKKEYAIYCERHCKSWIDI